MSDPKNLNKSLIQALPQKVIRVAVPRPLRQTYDYSIPNDWPTVHVGTRVRVSFARRSCIGLVVAVDPAEPHKRRLAAETLIDDKPILSNELMNLGHWLADYYHHPIGEVMAVLYPADARRGQQPDIQEELLWQTLKVEPELIKAPKQELLWNFLNESGATTATEIRAQGFETRLLQALEKKQLIESVSALAHFEKESPLELNDEQSAAMKGLTEAKAFKVFLLEGVTGSGKTEVYLQKIQEVVSQGGQALLLVPEIALTPQTVGRIRRRFSRVRAAHSNLNDRKRLAIWEECRRGDVDVLIGTRSAVFTQFPNLALVIVDEEHDGSFKQTDNFRYNARDVAVKRAHTLQIPLILGSATPSLESFQNARQGKYAHLRLTKRAGGAVAPQYHLLDIRGHTLQEGFSNPMIHVIRRHLEAKGQVLVFLNRRGFAPSFICTHCGWQAVCDNCDARMTLHTRPEQLRCHHCDTRSSVPTKCPKCTSNNMLAVGTGTQRGAAGIRELFPDIPVIRVDRDTVRSQKSLNEKLETINEGNPAVLIGTQMLAKGHHFPKVTLVAILSADGGLFSADFKSPEHTVQLITQVAGRAGRAENPGEVWIQTYQPDHPLLQSIIQDDYHQFAHTELENRETASLPPFQPLALLRAESPLLHRGREFLEACCETPIPGLEILGPAPSPMHRRADRFRWQCFISAANRGKLHSGLRQLTPRLESINSTNLRWSLDIDPLNTF